MTPLQTFRERAVVNRKRTVDCTSPTEGGRAASGLPVCRLRLTASADAIGRVRTDVKNRRQAATSHVDRYTGSLDLAMDVYLVDGTYELFRHYYALPSARDADGREIGAVRGVLASVLGMINAGATHVG